MITGSTIYQFVRSPFSVWCDAHAPATERDPPSEFQERLWRAGREHEARVVSALYPHARPVDFATEEEGAARALDAMRAGVPALHGAPLLLPGEGLGGRADVLVRDERAPSRFGSYHYRVKEVKLARHLGPEHVLQAALYNHVLGAIQGMTPPTFTLVNADRVESEHAHDAAALARAIDEIRAIRAGKRVDPVYGGGLWPWESYADQRAIAADDVSLVDGVGPALRGSLVAAGFATVRALAAAREEELARVAGVGEVRRKRLPVAAGALARGEHVRLGPCALPSATTEVFLDLEGTSEQLGEEGVEPIDYLIGALERRDGKEEYHAFVAHGMGEEGAMMRAFVAWLAERPDAILYHWHGYEAVHLRRLAQRHGLERAWTELIQPRLRDLHKDATRAFVFPTYGTSLKKIAPYLGFRWRHKDVNAMESIALYLDYARDPAAHAADLQRICDYNEDDCRATLVVKDWLAAQAASSPP